MAQIEFIDEPVPEGAPAAEPRPPRRPIPRGVKIAGALAAVAALVVWALVQPSGAPQAKTALSTGVKYVPFPTPSPEITQVLPRLGLPSPATGCATSACAATTTVPADVRAALDEYLKQVSHTTIATTISLGAVDGSPTLVSRLITTHVGAAEVVIRLRPYQHNSTPPTTGIVTTPAGRESSVFEISNASVVVDVQWIATPGVTAPDALETLAGDPRLEALS
ncbi:hypothetical protein [Jatrophihabitans sp.]|uniref:hypothetical protein n=1 Tax=Jatrophihabitans sp. TaxID=1932789 RepID=UPI0030C6623F|nr:hypothetical protein [Jatrophihabitans sp.]